MLSLVCTSTPGCNNATPSLLLQIIVALLYGHTDFFGVAPPGLNVGVPVHMLPLMNLEPILHTGLR